MRVKVQPTPQELGELAIAGRTQESVMKTTEISMETLLLALIG